MALLIIMLLMMRMVMVMVMVVMMMIQFVSAIVAVVSSQFGTSSSASWNDCRPPQRLSVDVG